MTWIQAYVRAANDIYKYLGSKGIKVRCSVLALGPKANSFYSPGCIIAKKTIKDGDISEEEIYRYINSTFNKYLSQVTVPTTSLSRWSRTLRQRVALPVKNSVRIMIDDMATTTPRIPLHLRDPAAKPY